MRKIFIAAACALASMGAMAQNHEVGIYAGGGLHSIYFNPQDGQSKLGFGGQVSVEYRFFFNDYVGLGLGVNAACYGAGATYNMLETSNRFDAENQLDYELRTAYSDFRESQHLVQAEVPIALYVQKQMGDKMRFLWGLGAKLALPVWNQYRLENGSYTTTAYYPATGVEYANLPQHGLGAYDAAASGASELKKLGAEAFTDLGFNCRVAEHTSVYFGLYVAYGLTDLRAPSDKMLIESDLTFSGTLGSNQISKANTLSAGLKLGLTLDFLTAKGKAAKAAKAGADKQPADGPEEVAKLHERTLLVERVVSDTVHQTVNIEDTVTLQTSVPEEYLAIAKAVSDINFAYNSTTFPQSKENSEKLDRLVECLNADPNIVAILSGHTCDIGSEEVNNRIGMLRAKAVKRELEKRGADSNQIFIETMGKTDPLKPNDSEANRSDNRQVEVNLGYAK